uniref:Large ribosomal subunit protein bL35 n=1 Tax=uncultured Alphaproteobacteria bacterium TaxID=91750 RepID=H5SJZ9_9PROT|nr:50S ribosomal protein L35 [uncultured Alphaproteobacteria bacterium]
MAKLKTKRAAAKRFKFTATGKIKRAHAYHRHNFEHRSRKQKRATKGTALVDPADARLVRLMLPYGRR